MPEGAKLSEVMLLIVAIVGTTVAPWQLFFQQSYIVDKRITPRFIRYERLDLCIGIALVMIGAVAMMAFCAAIFAGKPEFGNYVDALGTAKGLEQYAGQLPAILFAVALLDASIIGAAAVSLATAYAIGDVLSLRHSLHRKPKEAKGFYGVYFGLILLAAALVLTPGTPLGLLTTPFRPWRACCCQAQRSSCFYCATIARFLVPGSTAAALISSRAPLSQRLSCSR